MEIVFFKTVAFIMDMKDLDDMCVPVPDEVSHFNLEDFQEYGDFSIEYWGDDNNTLWSGWRRK